MPDLPPADDQLEVSVFGSGSGECIVVHLGGGRWMVVDSCVDATDGRPVALSYLSRLGLDPASAIREVVVTHWHDDHCRGAAALLEGAPDAQLWCSAALRSDEFRALRDAAHDPLMSPSGVGELVEALRTLRKRQAGRGASTGPKWALANRKLCQSEYSAVHSLSPSDGTLGLALRELAELVPRKGQPKRRFVAQKPNELSVVLWVEFGGLRVLLGADLIATRDERTGWQAIIDAEARPPGRAMWLKVPHHGSSGAEHEGVWSELLEPEPYAALTAFTPSALPKAQDLARLRSRTRRLWLTSSAEGRKARDLARGAKRLMQSMGAEVLDELGPMGHVRLRGRAGGADISVELRGQARGCGSPVAARAT